MGKAVTHVRAKRGEATTEAQTSETEATLRTVRVSNFDAPAAVVGDKGVPKSKKASLQGGKVSSSLGSETG